MSKTTVLVVGDVMLDRWIEGSMERISPESSSPVVRQLSTIQTPGGAGNVAAGLLALGCNVLLAGVGGNDPAEVDLQFTLGSLSGPDSPARLMTSLATGTGPTLVKTRITCGGQQVLRLDTEQLPLANEAALRDAIVVGVQAYCDRLAAIVVSDYGKGAMTPGLASLLLEASSRYAIPLLVDTKPEHFAWYRGSSVLKPNLREATAFAKSGSVHPALAVADPADQAVAAGMYIRDQVGIPNVIVTCGAAGLVWVGAAGYHHYTAAPVPVYDVTGAGDTVMAVLAAMSVHGWSHAETLERAVVAGSLAVQRHRTAVITRDELEDAMVARHGWAGKFMGPQAVKEFVARKRRAGLRIVLTNGCFDALHYGHLSTLEFAKQQGDVLVVAFNDDASTTALKGEGRPLVPGSYRGMQLAMTGVVDAVVEFDGDVEALVRLLKPDVLTKGAEYVPQAVAGADYVAQLGGRVAFAPMREGISTTKIAESNPEAAT